MILRATWDYIDRLDEFLAWTTRVPNLLNAPEVVAWNTDKRYLARPRSTPACRRCRAGSSRRASGSAAQGGEVVVKPAVGAGSVGAQRFTDSDRGARACRGTTGRRAAPCWCSPMTRGSRTARRRWCSSAAGSRTRSPRARSCRRRGSAGVRRVRHLRRGVADARRAGLRAVGRRPRRAGRRGRPPRHRRRRAAVRPRRRHRRPRRSAAAGAGAGRAVAGLAAARRRPRGPGSSASSRWASSQPSSGSGSVRSRIDAHSAAVAAVHAAAPATWTATSAAGTPVKNCTVPTEALRAHQHQQHAQPQQHRPRRVHGQQPEAQADQQRQVGDQQRRVHVHQRGDLDLQPRHRPARALVAGVRPGAGHQRAGDQHARPASRAVRAVSCAQRLRHHEASSTPSSGSPILT